MNEVITLLKAFGFTARDAKKVAARALENNLELPDIQAWIDEARSSTSLHNPLGFVRARLQDGDKLPDRSAADCRHIHRQRYQDQFSHLPTYAATHVHAITRTCTCGHVFWIDSFCEDCDLCPLCCKCDPKDLDKE